MKTNFWKFAAAFVVGIAAMVACQKEQMKPVFPEEVKESVESSTTVELSFEANMDWVLTVPQETIAYFWLEDAEGNKLAKLEGTAGKQTVTIGISEEPNFDNDVVCNVTLTMGEQSSVIATYTLPKAQRVFNAFPCKITDGDLTWKEEGGLDYSNEAVTEATLVYNDVYGIVMPFIFESNFNYEVVAPEWVLVENSGEETVGNKGTCTVRVSVNYANVPEGTNSAALQIKARNTETVVSTITLTLPDLSSYLNWDVLETIEFTGAGKYVGIMEQDSYTSFITTAKDVKIFAVGNKVQYGMVMGPFAGSDLTWVNISTSEWDETDGPVQTLSVSISLTANEGAAREAELYAIPASVAGEDWNTTTSPFTSDWTAVKPEYAQYKVATIKQEAAGPVGDMVTLTSTEGAEISTLDSSSDYYSYLSSEFGVSAIYNIDATTSFSVKTAKPFSNITRLGADGQVNNDLFTVEVASEFDLNITVNSTAATSGIIIFKDESWVNFAAIVVNYTPATTGGSTLPEFVPTETLGLMTDYGDRVALAVMESSHPAAAMLYEKYNTQNIWTLDCNNQGPLLTFSQAITSIEVLDKDFNASTVPFVQPQGTYVMIQAPTQKDVVSILLLKNATGNVMGVVYYTFTF